MSLPALFRFVLTLAFVGMALVLGPRLWNHYMYSPWTRDGRVRANVIDIAPDVSGIVNDVQVRDNQTVHRGDVLFRIDRERFNYALEESEAQVALRKAQLDISTRQAARRAQLGDAVISTESREEVNSQALQAQANYRAALAARDVARLNVTRSTVRAPADGFVTNLNLFPGDYVTAGVARLALIDRNSYWVYGYFEETRLPGVQVGDQAEVRLLSGGPTISAHVESIARGISDRDNPADGALLANVNPIFTWVRLAQRVPVRIHIDRLPDNLLLAAGMTCTVTILPQGRVSGQAREALR